MVERTATGPSVIKYTTLSDSGLDIISGRLGNRGRSKRRSARGGHANYIRANWTESKRPPDGVVLQPGPQIGDMAEDRPIALLAERDQPAHGGFESAEIQGQEKSA